jgi:hypothetical protein
MPRCAPRCASGRGIDENAAAFGGDVGAEGKLEKLLARNDGMRFSEHLDGHGTIVFKHACKLGLEGIVSKRRDLPYRSGRCRG